MANTKNQKNSPIDVKTLERFVEGISVTQETPAIMQMIAEKGDWLILARDLVNTSSGINTELWRQFKQVCQNKKLNPERIKSRIIPAIQALGLSIKKQEQLDYYKFLGINPSASPEDIRRAYHRKAKSFHPDTRKNIGDDRAFIKLTEGYQILKNPDLRAHYDQSRRSIETWCEGAGCISDDIDATKRRNWRNRYFIQLGVIVAVMVFMAFIFNIIYESRAINDGYYVGPKQTASKSSHLEIIAPDQSIEGSAEHYQKTPLLIDHLKQEKIKQKSIQFKSSDIQLKSTNRQKLIESQEVKLEQKKVDTVRESIKKEEINFKDRGLPVIDQGRESLPIIDKEIDTKFNPPKRIALENYRKQNRKISNRKKKLVEHKSSRRRLPPEKVGEKEEMIEGSALTLLRSMAAEEIEIERVGAFIRTYTKTYEKRDYLAFSRLFTEDAIENGMTFSSLAPNYQHIFSTIDKFDYKIELHKTSLLMDRGVIRTEGIYKIAWTNSDGSNEKSEGPILFEIVKIDGDYRVRSLEYEPIDSKSK